MIIFYKNFIDFEKGTTSDVQDNLSHYIKNIEEYKHYRWNHKTLDPWFAKP